MKKMYTREYTDFYYIKVDVKGCSLHGHVIMTN